MKTKLTATSAAAMFALIGLSRIALADGAGRFTPVENLPPEQRQEVFNKVSEMTKGADLDWDHVAVGVDDQGDVVIMSKADANLPIQSSPTCFVGAAHGADPNK